MILQNLQIGIIARTVLIYRTSSSQARMSQSCKCVFFLLCSHSFVIDHGLCFEELRLQLRLLIQNTK